jgi:hypothetical protein
MLLKSSEARGATTHVGAGARPAGLGPADLIRDRNPGELRSPPEGIRAYVPGLMTAGRPVADDIVVLHCWTGGLE